MKTTRKKRALSTSRNTASRLPKLSRLSDHQKETISKEIREYSYEDIVKDYERLVQIGCNAKKQSNKMLVGNRVVDAFTFTERLNTVGSKGIRFYDFWKNRSVYTRKNYVKKYLAFANKQHKQKPAKVWYNLFRFYFTSINCFRPLVAMEYYCMFSPKCVLDMTAGWGGRLVGACALNIPEYIGIDNNIRLKPAYQKLTHFLQPRTTTKIDMRFEDALNVDYSTLKYDMVFTSPPYYDLEQYGNSSSSSQNSPIIKEEWDETFYKPLFQKTYASLESGGHYCLNIPTELFERVCLQLLGKPWKIFPLKKSDRQNDVVKKYVEYVYVWKKDL